MKKAIAYINPPDQCDICKAQIADKFYDCYVPTIGCWANVCQECFNECDCRLGTGRGQCYVKLDDTGKFVKTAG